MDRGGVEAEIFGELEGAGAEARAGADALPVGVAAVLVVCEVDGLGADVGRCGRLSVVGPITSPVRGIMVVRDEVLSVMVSAPVNVPAVDASILTAIAQLSPGISDGGH